MMAKKILGVLYVPVFIYIYNLKHGLRKVGFLANPSTSLVLLFGFKMIVFMFLAPISLLLLHRILFPTFAEVRTFFWKKGYGRNWEHSVPNFDHPTFLVS
jgi:hypothetical protein